MPALKTVIRVGSSCRDWRVFPEPAKDHMGYALSMAQQRRRASRYEDIERLWRGRGGGSVRASRFPKEIEDWTPYGAPGPGAGEATAA